MAARSQSPLLLLLPLLHLAGATASSTTASGSGAHLEFPGSALVSCKANPDSGIYRAAAAAGGTYVASFLQQNPAQRARREASRGVQIEFRFDEEQPAVPAATQAAFEEARDTLEQILVGYVGVAETMPPVVVHVRIQYIDGPFSVVGSAGPRRARQPPGSDKMFVEEGAMTFDSADVERMMTAETLPDVVLHELIHVLGFGSLWPVNANYETNSFKYAGTAATSAFAEEFQACTGSGCSPISLGYVPVEGDLSSGSNNGHWDEVDVFGRPTGYKRRLDGQDLAQELMTSFLNAPVFLSQTTIMTFVDLGYVVADYASTTQQPTSPEKAPLPEGCLLLDAAGLCAECGLRYKNKRGVCEYVPCKAKKCQTCEPHRKKRCSVCSDPLAGLVDGRCKLPCPAAVQQGCAKCNYKGTRCSKCVDGHAKDTDGRCTLCAPGHVATAQGCRFVVGALR